MGDLRQLLRRSYRNGDLGNAGARSKREGSTKNTTPRAHAAACARGEVQYVSRNLLDGGAGIQFLQAGSFATQTTQIIQLCAPHFRRANHFHFVHNFGVNWEDALHALAEADLANREARLKSLSS